MTLVGAGSATYILLSGRLIDTEEANDMGLLTKVVAQNELTEYTYKPVSEMAELAPLSHARNKRIRDIVLRNTRPTGLSSEEDGLPNTNLDGSEFHEGRTAFIEERNPKFTGR